MSDEVELKFDVEPASVASIRAAPALAATLSRTETSESQYFDAPGGALRKAGLSLRVRRTGSRFVQTAKLKKSDAAGLFVRDEWEAEVPRFALDLDAFGAEPRRRVGGKLDGGRLRRVVTTRFARTSWQIEHAGSLIEVALDEGIVSVGRKQAPLTELELELKDGDPAALFGLAAELGRAAPLRIGAMSKNERGYALAEGRLGRVAKAGPVQLAPGMSEAEAFRTIAHACLHHFRLNEIALLAGRDAEALHQARVALRRLRAALSLFRGTVRGKDYQAIREELRWFARQFGDARNLDVLLAGPLLPDDEGLRAALRAERDRAYDQVDAALRSERGGALMLRLTEWLQLGRWRRRKQVDAPVLVLAERKLERQWRKVRRRGAELAALDGDAQHQLRIDIKKIRYAAEFLSGLFPARESAARSKRFVGALKELQERLGIANDARVAAEVIGRLAPHLPLPEQPPVSLKSAEKAFRRAAAAAGYWEAAA